MAPRRFTLVEANALLPRLRPLFPRLRQALEAMGFAAEQAEDLERLYGLDALAAMDHPSHHEHHELVADAEANRAEVQRILDELEGLGVELKDPQNGLVDFRAMRLDEEVYLCWREGEARVEHWHPLVGGFAGRRPLDGLTGAAESREAR